MSGTFKFSQLPAATGISDSDLLALSQDMETVTPVSRRATMGQAASFLRGQQQDIVDASVGVANLAALRALNTAILATGVPAYVQGYAVSGDRGSGSFQWDAAATGADNGGTIILPNSAPAIGRWLRTSSNGFTVGDFGALLDGATDDTSAFERAFAALEAGSLDGALRFPAGVAVLRRQLTLTGIGASLIGDGSSATILQWQADATSGGIRLIASDGSVRFCVSGMGLITARAATDTALDIDYSTSIGLSDKQADVSDVQAIYVGAGRWGVGIRVNNGRNSVLQAAYVRGPTGAMLYGTAYLVEGEATDVKFLGCQAVSMDIGWDMGGTTEGMILVGCVGVNQRIGVRKIHASGGEPWLNLNGCHLNAREICVQTQNCIQTFFSECLLYARTDVTGAWTAIDIDGSTSQDVQVRGGVLHGLGRTGTRTGIRVRAGFRMQFDGVCYIGLDIGRQIDAGVTSITSSGSRFAGTTTREIDNGAGTKNFDVTRYGEWGIDGTGNSYLDIVGDTSSNLRLVDAGADVDKRRITVQGNDGVLKLVALNDDNSVRVNFARFADNAVSLGGDIGSEPFRAVPVANLVGRLQVTGSPTGGAVILDATGDTNTSMYLRTNGGGVISLRQDTTVMARLAGTLLSFGGDLNAEALRVTGGSYANHWKLRGGVPGQSPRLEVEGTDTNAHGEIVALGTSGIMVGATSQGCGFMGATPSVRQSITGSRAGNSALADLLTKLASKGLIIDGTTA